MTIEVISNSFVDGSLGFLGSSEACGSSEGSSGFVGEVMSALASILKSRIKCVLT